MGFYLLTFLILTQVIIGIDLQSRFNELNIQKKHKQRYSPQRRSYKKRSSRSYFQKPHRNNFSKRQMRKQERKQNRRQERKRYRRQMRINFDELEHKQMKSVGRIPSFNELYFKDHEKIQNFRRTRYQKRYSSRRLSNIENNQKNINLDIKDQVNEIQKDLQYVKLYQEMLAKSNLQQRVKILEQENNELLQKIKQGQFVNKNEIKKTDDNLKRKKQKQRKVRKKQRFQDELKQKNDELTKGLPQKISWQQYVIRVEDQGDCSSCYSFSVTSAIEILWNAKMKQKIELSDQEIVDCNNANDGCEGGSALGVLEYIQKEGISYRKEYPYIGEQQKCLRNPKLKKFKQTFQYFGIFDKIQLLKALQYGPVVVFHHTDDDFKDYQGGVIDTAGCHGKLNHSAVVIGYDLLATEPYILLMNNWGDVDWGEKGFYKMKLGDLSDKSDMCNMFGHFSNILIKINQLNQHTIYYKWNLLLVKDKKEKFNKKSKKLKHKVIYLPQSFCQRIQSTINKMILLMYLQLQ